MFSITLDTACCIEIYKPMPDSDVLSLLQMGLRGRIDVKVSDVAEEEVRGASLPERETYLRRLGMFPTLEIRAEFEGARDQIAATILKTLFPDSPSESGSHEHNLRDCRHLATHHQAGRDCFITYDKRLLHKAAVAEEQFGIVIKSPADTLERVRSELAPDSVEPSIAAREYRDDDEIEARAILRLLARGDSEINSWITGILATDRFHVTVGELDGRVCAVAVTVERDQHTMEVVAFVVSREAGTSDIGGHLLFHLIRNWVAGGYERVHASLPAESSSLIALFGSEGFLVSGFQPGHNQLHDVQLVKLLKRLRLTEPSYAQFADEIGRLFSNAAGAGLSQGSNWLVVPAFQGLSTSHDQATGIIRLTDLTTGKLAREFTPTDLEIAFHPLRIALQGRRPLIVPIHPEWADQLMNYPRPQQQQLFPAFPDPLLIRRDNAYYCYPRCEAEVASRPPILFYVTSPISACVGEARVLQYAIDFPEVLHALYGSIGVYSVQAVRQHAKRRGIHQGMALAVRFSHYLPFSNPVPLKDMREALDNPGLTPQGLHAIKMSQFEEIRQRGGLEW